VSERDVRRAGGSISSSYDHCPVSLLARASLCWRNEMKQKQCWFFIT